MRHRAEISPQTPIAGITAPWPLVMGIVNVTPDSFHDGGQRLDPDAAIAHGRDLAVAGAAILDIGGESTRPGAGEISSEAELERVIPVIRALADGGHVVSVDTRKAAVMAGAVAAGARMINDVTALRHDPESLALVAGLEVPVVLMHSRGTPGDMQTRTGYDDVVGDVMSDLAARIAACVEGGVAQDRLIIDPGLGFAKTARQSAALLGDIARFHALGCPLLIGASRKTFIGALSGTARSADRLPGSLAAALWAGQQGAAIVRVHDVAETVQALEIFRALCYIDGNDEMAE
jgi:dihydropteroate synthase